MNNPAGQQALYNALHSVLGYLTPYVAQDVSEKRGLHRCYVFCRSKQAYSATMQYKFCKRQKRRENSQDDLPLDAAIFTLSISLSLSLSL